MTFTVCKPFYRPLHILYLHWLPTQWLLWSRSLHWGMWHPTAVNASRHAWLHKCSWAMADSTLFELLGLEPSASLDEIIGAYRTSAKKFHPDKNSNSDTTGIFQMNTAYRNLMSSVNNCENADVSYSCHSMTALPNVSLYTRENTFSVTIDIVNIMFLVFREECETHHVDRGPSGIQYRFDYSSPDHARYYGSLSLTFYPTNARLLAQGTSYLLWVDEHLPVIYQRADTRLSEDLSTWRISARRLGLGLRQTACTTRQSSRHAATTKQVVSSLTADTHMSSPVPQVSSISDCHLNVFSGHCPQPGPNSPSVLHLGGPDTVHQDGASATVAGSRSVTVANHNTQKTTNPTTEDVVEPSTVPTTQVLGSPPPHPLPADDQGTPAYVSPGTGENESLHSHAHDKQQEKKQNLVIVSNWAAAIKAKCKKKP